MPATATVPPWIAVPLTATVEPAPAVIVPPELVTVPPAKLSVPPPAADIAPAFVMPAPLGSITSAWPGAFAIREPPDWL